MAESKPLPSKRWWQIRHPKIWIGVLAILLVSAVMWYPAVRKYRAIKRLEAKKFGVVYLPAFTVVSRLPVNVLRNGWISWVDHQLGIAHSSVEKVKLNVPPVTENDFGDLNALGSVKQFDFQSSQLNDHQMPHLAKFTKLQELYLRRTRIRDGGLSHIVGLRQLTYLHIGSTKVTDAGLKYVALLPKLEVLWLDHTPITGSGLLELKSMPKLSEVHLDQQQGAAISEVQWQQIRTEMPNCEFHIH